MNLKKLSSILAVLLLSFFVFTSCDDTNNPLIPDENLPTKITGLAAGCVNETTIFLMWDEHINNSEPWFKDLLLTVKAEGADSATEYVLPKNATEFSFNTATEGVVYTFTIVGRNTDDEYSKANIATIQWGTAAQFKKNDNDADIKVYGSNSDFGSGLELYNAAGEAPKVWRVVSQENWNLGLTTTGSKVLFGSASALGYVNVKTPADAEITDLFDVDIDVLGNVVFEDSPATFSYSKKTIDLLNNEIAKKATKGVCFFARTLDKKHYAKIIILKKGGKFLQGSGDDQYVQLYISYQRESNVPFAKR